MLRHLQSEMIPFDMSERYRGVNISTDLLYFGTVKPFPWKNLERFDHDTQNWPIPPSIDVYTGFTKWQFVSVFVGQYFLQILLTWLVKLCSNEDFRYSETFEQLCHVILNTHIPTPVSDWFHTGYTSYQIRSKKKEISIEVYLTAFLTLLFNLILLGPLFYLSKYSIYFKK